MATTRAFSCRGWGGVCLAALVMGAAWCGAAAGFTPESPEVRAMVKNGLKYLETASDDRPGGKALIGLAFFKDGAGEDHPRVKEGIEASLFAAVMATEPDLIDVYSLGISIIFLCEVNPSKYRIEIEKMIAAIKVRQKPGGGWGYLGGPHGATGDTSMTQYAVLSLWTASRTEVIQIPRATVRSMASGACPRTTPVTAGSCASRPCCAEPPP